MTHDTDASGGVDDGTEEIFRRGPGHDPGANRNGGNSRDLAESGEDAVMSAPIDLLSVAIAKVRPYLDRSTPVGRRLRIFWAGVVAARKLGAADVVAEEFTALAVSSGLAADLGHHAKEDIAHVVRWGLLNRDPFGGMS